MSIPSQIIQYAISGITSGSIYAIVGVCWSLVYLVSRILNFTTGDFVMLGGTFTWIFVAMGIGEAPAGIMAIACVVFIGIVIERAVIRPVKHPTENTYMVMTFAASSIISATILLTVGSYPHTIAPFISTDPIHFLGASLNSQVIVVLAALIFVTAGLTVFLNRTLIGKALIAAAVNPVGARFVGIKINSLHIICFALAGGLGAIAGLVITPITFTGYGTGAVFGLKGLAAGLAGEWKVSRTVVIGLGLGLAEGFFAGFISSGWKDALPLIVMIMFLIGKTMNFSTGKRKSFI